MSEITEHAAPETTAPAEEKPGRRLWPLLAWGAIAAVVVTAGTVAALGTTGALIAGGCVAGTAAGAAVLWRLPHLRKHFAGPRRAARMRSVRTRTKTMSAGGGRKGKLPGLGRGKALAGKLAGRRHASGRARTGRSALGRVRAAGRALLGRGRGGGKLAHGGGRRSGRLAAAPGIRGIRRALAGRGLRRAGKGAALLPAAAAIAGAKRLRARLRKLRGKGSAAEGTDKAEDTAAAQKPGEQAEDAPPPDRQPGQPLMPSATDHPTSRRHPVSNQLGDTAEAIQQGIGGFEPENVNDLGAFLQSLPGVYEALASGLQRVSDRFGDEFPLHPSVIEHLREMASGAAGQQEYAGEAHHIFLTTHEDDLERLENPRTGEEFMDVSNQ